MFESTAPFVLEELTCLAENHGYNGNLGPPCMCLLAHCLPCLNLLADRLVPKTQPQPAPRTPQDYAFLTESAKALRKQGLLPDWRAVGWDEALQAAQRRTADELWRIALEIDVHKVSVDLMTGLKRIGHEVGGLGDGVVLGNTANAGSRSVSTSSCTRCLRPTMLPTRTRTSR